MGMRLKISKLLSPEDIENLDSLKKDGVVWFTDSLPGSYQDYTDKHLKIVGPSSAVKDAVKLIDRMFDEALHRISSDPKADGLDVLIGERNSKRPMLVGRRRLALTRVANLRSEPCLGQFPDQ